MAKEFKDFIYLGKRLSELDRHYICADFEQDPDTFFAFAKDIDYGDTNRYRSEPSLSRSRFSDKLKFELHIIKNPEVYEQQVDRIFTSTDIRKVARWLTSTDTSSYLEFEYESSPADPVCFYFGQFTDIQSFHISGDIYGLKLIFQCSTPYGYSDEYSDSVECRGNAVSHTIVNNDDRLNEFCYPVIQIASAVTGTVFFCNLSDCYIYEQGSLTLNGSTDTDKEQLRRRIDTYALAHGYAVHYPSDMADNQLLPAVLFTFTGPDMQDYKGIACYLHETNEYYIIQGGFLSINVKSRLPIRLNAERLFIFDDLSRMIPFHELGIADIDYMYWPRLQSGNNTFLFWGEDCTFSIAHREVRKAGA